jgi:PAS domain S-box-containing protein
MTTQPQPTSPEPDREFYEELVTRSPIGMLTTNRELRVVRANPAARAILGIEDGPVTWSSVVEAVSPRHRKAVGRLFHRVIEHGHSPKFEVPLPTNEGTEKNVQVRLQPIRSENGEVTGSAVWMVDQTELRHRSDQLAQREKMASLATLAAGVAHHFNNILGGVATVVDYALTSLDFLAMKRALQTTAEATTRGSKIVQSLLSFAEHPQRPDDLSDLTEAVLTFAQLVEQPLAERGIELQLDIEKVPITAIPTHRIHQALGNLLSNAEEAMPHGGRITISLRADERHVILRFRDTGQGIPNGELPMVFEPFYTTKGLHAGGEKMNPGLGLSVVHGIVVEMGGTISAESPPGGGACFTIRVPIHRDLDEL